MNWNIFHAGIKKKQNMYQYITIAVFTYINPPVLTALRSRFILFEKSIFYVLMRGRHWKQRAIISFTGKVSKYKLSLITKPNNDCIACNHPIFQQNFIKYIRKRCCILDRGMPTLCQLVKFCSVKIAFLSLK